MSENNLPENFDSVIEKCFNILGQTSQIKHTVYNDVYDILYSSEKDYIHYFPHTLFLQLTSNCNLRCKHCFFSSLTDKYSCENDLTEEELFEQLKYFVEEVNILYCIISGGEIFTSPFLLKVIKYLKNNAVTVKLVTNGTLITENISKDISKYFTKYDVIQVSLEAPNADINDSIRGQGVFNKVVNSIKYLVKYNLNVEITFTANSINVTAIPEMYELAKKLKVKRLNIGKFSKENEDQDYLVPSTKDIFISISKLSDKFSDNDVQLLVPCLKIPDFLMFEKGKILVEKKLLSKDKNRTNYHCKQHHEQVTLFANGDIALCYECSIKDVIIGNIKNDSFENIWKNRFCTPLFKPRNINNHLCKNCKYISLCLSGCPLRAYLKYGTIEAPGHDCSYFKEIGGCIYE